MKKNSLVVFAFIFVLMAVLCTAFLSKSSPKAEAVIINTTGEVYVPLTTCPSNYVKPFTDKLDLAEYTAVPDGGFVETVTNEDVSLIYDSSTKILKIEGKGIVPNGHEFKNVEKIIIGNGITEISEAAFFGCTSLKEVVMPESLKIIGESAFRNCIALYEISFPDSLETIGGSAFNGCLNLKKISLGSGIRNIGGQAFYDTNYYLNEDNWKDGELYLDGCLLDAKVINDGDYTIKDGTKVIGGYLFSGAWNIKSFSIPDSVVGISDGAFVNCKINPNDIPESVDSIGALSFATTPDLHKLNSEVEISENIKSISAGAFYNRDVTAFSVDKNNPYFLSDENGVLFTKDMKKLIAFPDGSTLTSYTVPFGVTEIEDFAFAFCNLKNISMPATVGKIGYGAFSRCSQLSELIIPDAVIELDYYTFYYSKIERIDSGDGITSFFGDYGSETKYIKIGKSVQYTGSGFSGVIEYEVDPENPYYCNDEYGVLYNKEKTLLVSFPSCNPVEHYVMPSTVEDVGRCTDPFSNLKTLTFSENIKPDSDYLFWEQILGYPRNTFSDIIAEKYIMPESNEYFCTDENGVIFNKDKTLLVGYPRMNKSASYSVPEGVEIIAGDAFKNCDNLTEIHIPESVKTIGEYAFRECENITSVTGCEGLERIDTGAFEDCHNLREITIPDKPMRLGWNVISTSTTVFFLDETFQMEYVNGFYLGNHLLRSEDSFGTGDISIREGTLDIGTEAICETARNLYIPKSVKIINTNAFYRVIGLQNIYYAGTPEEWKEIDIFYYKYDEYFQENDILDDVVIHYNSTGIPVLETRPETVTDKDTGVSIDFDAARYNGEVEFWVSPNIDDGSAFDLITTETDVEDFFLYDITMNLNGRNVQPAEPVTVRLPVPEGFNPSRSVIFHIDTVTCRVERMDARVEDGYLVFETDHFSYYAIVEEKADCTIEFNHADKTINYKQSDSVSATASEGKVVYSSSDPDIVTVDKNGNITAKKIGTAVITATVEGTDISATCNVTVNYAWWQWIIRILLLGFIWY
ncbi:MAG: leucine-rich repeat protein [Clostridia bacterium]|nr:leucine-rich repeat protein [Clostridia bacterium]